jgi:hypothetical protein
MAGEQYQVYKHKQKPRYELVLRKGDPFPEESKEADWSLKGSFPEAQFRDETRQEVLQKGYSLTRWDITFRELSGS